MNQALAPVQDGQAVTPWQQYGLTQSKYELIRRTIADKATPDELELFLYQAHRLGLDPLNRQIYLIKRGSTATIQTSIDGYRLIADRTGQYAGSDDAVFEGVVYTEDGKDAPERATVTVWKLVQGQMGKFSATAWWDEYYPRGQYTGMWDKMPHTMLAKCAEALALRKAFPAELSGVYTDAEMDQADAIESTARVVSDDRRAGRGGAAQAPAQRGHGAGPARLQSRAATITAGVATAGRPEARPALPATEPQIKGIYAIGRGAQSMDEAEVEARCLELFGVRPSGLSRRQASEFMDALKAGTRKEAPAQATPDAEPGTKADAKPAIEGTVSQSGLPLTDAAVDTTAPVPVTPGQVKEIYELGGGKGLDSPEMDRAVKREFGAESVAHLTRKQAQELLAALKQR